MSINSLENFSVGTYNLKGCSSKLRRWQLASDIGKYKISVCCLQDTKSNYVEETMNGINLKFLNPQNKHHGMGFHDLIITNTLFQHPDRHITTWTGYRKNNNNDITKIYNQIDYVICKYNH